MHRRRTPLRSGCARRREDGDGVCADRADARGIGRIGGGAAELREGVIALGVGLRRGDNLYRRCRLSLRALLTTQKLLRLIAAAAIMGLSRIPKKG
jgi:hypothetical protein